MHVYVNTYSYTHTPLVPNPEKTKPLEFSWSITLFRCVQNGSYILHNSPLELKKRKPDL